MAKIKFTDISEKHTIPAFAKAKASKMLPIIIEYGIKHYNNTKKMRDSLLRACNIILYCLIEQEPIPHDWLTTDPLAKIPEFDDDMLQKVLGSTYLSDKNVEWDLATVYPDSSPTIEVQSISVTKPVTSAVPKVQATTLVQPQSKPKSTKKARTAVAPTDKTDLYLQGPKVPQFDSKSIWMQGQVGPHKLVIYESLPKIPAKQSDISVTTDVTKMTDRELMKLYPNCFIRTRNEKMYEKIDGIEFDNQLGLLLPICTFTVAQIKDNIVKYPHLYKLVREINGQLVSFYSHIEIDGQLYKTLDIWDSLPESKIIPRQPEFIKEYVVRRYLLERDILGVNHKYPIFGSLDPYLTLFMPSDEYIEYGYPNTHEIVIQCLKSRVSFKQTRNPVIRRLTAIYE